MPTNNTAHDLLFVNKTSSSKSLSNNKGDVDGLREINKHVQRSRDYEKERENRRNLRRARLLPLGWAPYSITHGQSLGTNPPSTLAAEVTVDSLPSPPETPETEEIGPVRSKPHVIPEAETLLSLVVPTWGSVEPFGQFKVSLNAEKHHILEYFVLKFFPAVTRMDSVAFMGHPRSVSSIPAMQVVRKALSDELHLLALLTAASARMKYVDRYQFSREDLPERLADITLRLLREYLASGQPITQELLQSILYMWALESYRRNWEAVITHGNMLMYLCNTYLGGFRNLDPYMRRMLWLADRFQAAATQSPPLIKERWETDDLSPQQYTCGVAAIREQGKKPMGYGFAKASEIFSPAFQKALDRVLDLCCIIQCHFIGVAANPLIPDRDWAVARSFLVADELIGFNEDRAVQSPVARDERLQDCVRLALIVWLAFIPASGPYLPSENKTSGASTLRAAVDAKPLRKRLGSIISSLREQPASNNERLLLFWVAGLGAVASELVENQEWFAVQFQWFANELEIHSWEAFTPVHERFLFLDHLKAGSLSKLTWLLQRAVYAKSEG